MKTRSVFLCLGLKIPPYVFLILVRPFPLLKKREALPLVRNSCRTEKQIASSQSFGFLTNKFLFFKEPYLNLIEIIEDRNGHIGN